MVRHFIILSSSYSKGHRIALDLVILEEKDIEIGSQWIEKIKDEYCFYIAGPVSCDSKEYYQKLFKKY